MSRRVAIAIACTLAVFTACDFHEYAQVESLGTDIDAYRTGCEVDSDTLLAGYLQYEANRFHYSGPTPTPGPATRTDLTIEQVLSDVWAHGCITGRRDALGAERATLAGIRDEIDLLEARLAELEGE